MIGSEVCFTIACDADPECDPWEEGQLHFPTVEAALDWARGNEWLVAGERLVCPDHARQADCEATEHRWGEWWDGTLEDEVSYRKRCCEHCGEPEYDPPFRELCLLSHAAREMKRGDL